MKPLLRPILLLLPALPALTQTSVDPALLAEIKQIKAVDNHAHPMAVTLGETEDTEFDAIPCGSLEFTSPPPVRLRFDNPIYVGAWRELYGYKHGADMSEANVRELLADKRRVQRDQGDNYPAWVLDRLSIQTMFANRVRPGQGLTEPRFRFVAYGDPLTLPFIPRRMSEANSDARFFFSREEALLGLYLKHLDLKAAPPTLDQYLARVVTPTLERLKRERAIAVKFVAAYMRPLSFENTREAEAARIYRQRAAGAEPSPAEARKLQDFLFRYVAREAGRLGLAVHIHTGGGCGHYFNLSNGNPLLLESVLNDPGMRKTTFVLVHGGYPFFQETAFLLEKPNVYADFSAQTFLLTPAALARVLRVWLEYEPEKVLFGTDASPGPPEVSWEESAWMTNKTAREALAIALTGMISDGDITRERASELARMVLRDNATRLYGLQEGA